MTKILSAAALISLLLAFPANTGLAQNMPTDFDPAVVRQFNQVHELLQSQMSQSSCQSFPKSGPLAGCGYEPLCSFLSRNSASGKLYESPLGGYLPNFALLKAADDLKIDFASSYANPILREQGKADMEVQKRAHSAFFDSMKKNGDEEAYGQLLAQALQSDLDSWLAGGPPAEARPETSTSRKGEIGKIDEELTRLEAATGQKLSPETRAAYLTYLKVRLERDGVHTLDDSFLSAFPVMGPVTSDPYLQGQLTAVNPSDLKARLDAARRAFEDARKAIEALIQSRVAEISPDASREMIHRLALLAPRFPGKGADSCGDDGLVYLNEKKGKVWICPASLILPAQTLRSILLGRMARWVDPCDLSVDLVASQDPQSNDILLDFASAGLGGRPNAGKVLSPGIWGSRNPFAETVACLGRPESAGLSLIRREEFTAELDRQLRELAASTEPESATRASAVRSARHKLARFFDRHGTCLKDAEAMKESFATWLTGEVISQDLDRTPQAQKARVALESVLPSLLDCPTVSKEAQNAIQDINLALSATMQQKSLRKYDEQDVRAALDQAQRLLSPTKPSTTQVDRILLAQPGLQGALGCPVREGLIHCE